MAKYKYNFELEADGYECGPGDYGNWQGYDLITASGNSVAEVLDDALVGITDQDGGEVAIVEPTDEMLRDLLLELMREILRRTAFSPLSPGERLRDPEQIALRADLVDCRNALKDYVTGSIRQYELEANQDVAREHSAYLAKKVTERAKVSE